MKKYLLPILLLAFGCGSYDLHSRTDRKKSKRFRNSKAIFVATQKQYMGRTVTFRENNYFEIYQSRKNKRGKYSKDRFYFGEYESSENEIVLRNLGSADGFYLDTLKWLNQKSSLIFKDSEVFLVKHRPR
ncbi:MAG TPA: hypothetical protein PKX92_14375 [Edaphocola sp.]|nr:hypothetical protein [Candidatus Dojkabacteria bacterium]HRP91210.1 hypothetical protein [Edaphocola sp.]